MPNPPLRLTLYTRADCSLCDQAAALLDRLADSLPFRWTPVDVDRDPALRARFDALLPVIALGEEVLVAAPLSEPVVRAALARVARRAEGSWD